MHQFIHQLRKAELHLHLDGSIEPSTLCEIDPALSLEQARAMYQYDDFLGFLQCFRNVNLRLQVPAHFALITRRLLENLEAQNVAYAEIILSVGVWLWREQTFEPFFEAIAEEAAKSPVRTRFLVDATRQFGVDAAWKVAKHAVSRRDRGIIGFGIGGDESRGPATDFKEVFAWVREQGLHIVPHAGEVTGPQSVWDALECGAERIGHGIRSIQDPVLVKHLADRQIPLEISISSNVRTGAVASLKEHPVRRLFDAGVPITLNTDDPPMFGATLEGEYALAASEFGFSREELESVAQNGFKFAFDAP